MFVVTHTFAGSSCVLVTCVVFNFFGILFTVALLYLGLIHFQQVYSASTDDMAPVLKTRPGKVSAMGRRKSPKKGRSGSSRRGKSGKKSRSKSPRSRSSKSSKPGKKKGKKGKRKMISPEEYGDMERNLRTSEKTRDMLMIKLQAMSHSREQYRKCAFSLLEENEHIQGRLIKVEKECIEVVGYLNQKRSAHEVRLEIVEKELAEVRGVEAGKRQKLENAYEAKIKTLNSSIGDKDNTIKMLQYEVNTLKELKDTNVKLESKNEELSKELLATMVRHQQQLVEYEAMILREKRNLEKIAKEEVSGLVDKAHEMAAKNVGAATLDIYNQNNCLMLSLQKYQQELSELRQVSTDSEKACKAAVSRAEVAEAALQRMRRELTVLQRTAEHLQEQLTRSQAERLQEAVSLQEVRAELRDWALQQRQTDAAQLQQVQRQLAVRDATVRRLRQLARRVLARRSQLEDFFLSALDHASSQATGERKQFWKEAEQQYREKQAAGVRGDAPPPEVMTLDASRTSSRDVADVWRRHNQWSGDVERLDVRALTWQQKESVLRVLFAQINGMCGRVRQRRKGRCPRKKTADVGVQKFGGQKRLFSAQSVSEYPVLSPYMDKSVQMLGL